MRKIDATPLDKVIIGIDPDVTRSGIAVLEMPSRRLRATALPFADLVDCIRTEQRRCEVSGVPLAVVVEAGWLNRGNWHITRYDRPQAAAAKGAGVGRNQQVGILLLELLRHWQIPCHELRPLPLKVGRIPLWHGRDGKITAEDVKRVTGYSKPTNQEARDAILLAWSMAGLPM